jgi:hypothetical protein
MKHKIIFSFFCLTFLLSLTAQENKTGQIEIMVSIPYVNNFYSIPEGESAKWGTGFWGISGGLGYQYNPNKFGSFTLSSQIQYGIPIPMGIDYEDGTLEDQYSTNLSITDNYQFNRWTFGYGLSYSRNSWRIRYFGEDYIPPLQVSRHVSNQSIGLNFATYYNVYKNFNVGIVYRPQFLTIDPTTKLNYQHSISLDIAWKWRIKTKKNK